MSEPTRPNPQTSSDPIGGPTDGPTDGPAGAAAAPPPGPFGPDGHPRRWAILAVLVVSLLIVVLDNTVLNIALPTIQRDLDASQSQLVWSIDSYVLVFAALLFTWGVLGDKYGRKRILLIGLAIFAVGSAISAIARNPAQLIAFRAIMGIGGAAVIPVTLAIITVVFPPRERGRAIGAWAGAVGGAVALGPVLGGLLLENPQWFSWLIGNDYGSVFLINVPIVAIGMIGIIRLVPESRNPNPQRLDVVGLLLSIAGLTAIVYGIIHAGDTKDWLAASVLVPIVLGVAVIAVFVVMEARSDHASFDVSLFRNRGFAVSLTAVSLAFFALSGVTFTFPFYLQIARGYSTLQAGLCFLPFAVGQILGAPRSAKMVARFGDRAVITVGLLLVAGSLIFLTQLRIDTPLWAGARGVLRLRPRHGQRDRAGVDGHAEHLAAQPRRRRLRGAEHRPAGVRRLRRRHRRHDPRQPVRRQAAADARGPAPTGAPGREGRAVLHGRGGPAGCWLRRTQTGLPGGRRAASCRTPPTTRSSRPRT